MTVCRVVLADDVDDDDAADADDDDCEVEVAKPRSKWPITTTVFKSS